MWEKLSSSSRVKIFLALQGRVGYDEASKLLAKFEYDDPAKIPLRLLHLATPALLPLESLSNSDQASNTLSSPFKCALSQR